MDTYQTEFSDNRPEEKTSIQIEQLLSEFTFLEEFKSDVCVPVEGQRKQRGRGERSVRLCVCVCVCVCVC